MWTLKLTRRQFGGPGGERGGTDPLPSLPSRGPGGGGPGPSYPDAGPRARQRGRPAQELPGPADLGAGPGGAGDAGRPKSRTPRQWPPPGRPAQAAPRRRLFWESEIKMAEVRPRR